jgi:hypothetical protein
MSKLARDLDTFVTRTSKRMSDLREHIAVCGG